MKVLNNELLLSLRVGDSVMQHDRIVGHVARVDRAGAEHHVELVFDVVDLEHDAHDLAQLEILTAEGRLELGIRNSEVSHFGPGVPVLLHLHLIAHHHGLPAALGR